MWDGGKTRTQQVSSSSLGDEEALGDRSRAVSGYCIKICMLFRAHLDHLGLKWG